MDIRQLEIFVSVAEHKGFLSSAEKLHLSQSTVSTHIAALEQELEIELIRRTTRTFHLTPEGERLYVYAKDILALQQKAFNELSGSSKRLLRIGTSSVPAQCLLPQVLDAFHQRSPDMQFEIMRTDSLDIIQKVSAGNLDLGFAGTKIDSPCTFVPIASDELVIVTPNTPVFQAHLQSHTPAAELLKNPFLMRVESSGTMKETMRFISQLGIAAGDIHILAHMNDAETLRLCIAQGLGISILSYKSVEDLIHQKKVLAFSFDEDVFCRDLYIVYRKNGYLPEYIKNFISFSTKFFNELAP